MASLIIDTGVESHPQIAVDAADFKNELINFRWLGSAYPGDCAEKFTISVVEHGDMTVSELITVIASTMISKLNGEGSSE